MTEAASRGIYAILAMLLSAGLFSGCDSRNAGNPGGIVAGDSTQFFREAFAQPQACQSCHPQHVREWQMSMHAYAFVDPVFFALNEIGQQRSGNALDQFCVKCHSPFAPLLGEQAQNLTPDAVSALAGKGVQCDVCHLVKSFRPGEGIDSFHLNGVRRGPIADPRTNDFHASVYDSRFDQSAMCAACHDVNGPSGIVLERTSSEWDASPYSAMGLSCQGCHMPTYSGQAAAGGPLRDKVHRHTFVGVDIPLVDFPGRAEMIAMVGELLQNSVTMTVLAQQIAGQDSLAVSVTISNDRTGHHIPSGTIFERQMWLEVIVRDAGGNVVFASGTLDDNGDLRNHHSDFVSADPALADADLVLFNGVPYANGEETLFFWEADSIAARTIAPFDAVTRTYAIPATAGNLSLSVRLRFRSLPPYLLRAIGQDDLLDDLLIFDMAGHSQTVVVN